MPTRRAHGGFCVFPLIIPPPDFPILPFSHLFVSMKNRHPHLRLLLLALGLPTSTWAIDKANNTTNLDQGTSWVGGTVPGAGDLAVWTNTVTTANSVLLGSDTFWGGLQVVSPGGVVTIGAGNNLTLGASGINLSSASQNLALNCGVTLGAAQSWSIASGRVVIVSGYFDNAGQNLTITGNAPNVGDIAATIFDGAFSGAGNLSKTGLGILNLGGTGSGVNFAMSAGTVIQVDAGTLRNHVGSTASWASNLSSLKVASGAIFDIGNTHTVVDELSGVGAGFGSIQKDGISSATLTIGANNGGTTFSGAIKRNAGVFTLSKTGTGTATLGGGTGTDNTNLLVEVKNGTLVLDKTTSVHGTTASAGVRSVYGVSDIATGATLKLAGAPTSGAIVDQINHFGVVATGIVGSGAVVMGGGTLDMNGRNEGVDALSGSGFITNHGAASSILTVGMDGGSGTFTGTIVNGTSTMALTKTGNGTLTLTSNSTYTGATLLQRGTLVLSGSLPNSSLTVSGAANSTLSGEGSVLALTMGTGTRLAVDPSTSGALSTGAFSITGTNPVSVVLTGGSFSPGAPFKVINYTNNANSWPITKFTLANAANFRSPSFSDSGSAVSLSIGASNISWNNASADSKWNIGISTNFVGSEKFYTFDTVTFGNVPVSNQVIAVDGTLLPSSWIVNSSLNYTFNNGTSGVISGTTGLVKSGTGRATVNLNNTFTGVTTVNGGTLAIASDAALGTPPMSATSARIILDGGTLALNSAFALSPNRGITLGAVGAGLDTSAAGNSALVEIGSDIAGSGSLSISANGDTNDAPTAAGSLWLSSGFNTFAGDVTVRTGLLSMSSVLGTTGNSVLLDGGGLVDQGVTANFSTNILVGAISGTIRTANLTEISGSIANAPSVSNALLRHTEGGVLTLSGSGAGFAGTYSNLRGATVISASSANWAQTDFVLDTNGSTLTFSGGGLASAKSITSTRNVLANFGTTLSLPSITMNTNAHAFLSNAGEVGGLTSATGTLTVTNGAASGSLGTLDHQLQLVVRDFNGSTPLTLVKNHTNLLILNQPNSYTGGTVINMGRVQPTGASSLGSGLITVNSGGQVYLASAGITYPNNFLINGIGQPETQGTLGAIRFENNSISGNVTVASSARMTAFTASTTGAVSGALQGSANLETTGAGAISLNGNAAGYTGTLTAAQGTLILNSPSLGGSLAVAATATLNSESTVVGNITLGTTGTSQLIFNPSTTAALTATGALTVNGTVVVSLSGAIPAAGTYKVIQFGSKNGPWTAANFSVGSNFRPGTSFTVNANDVSLTITKEALTWNNAAGTSVWDTNNALNFRDNIPTNQKFYWGDDVAFTDLPGAAQTIAITGVQQPSSVTVDSVFNYTFTAGASGVIAGGSSLLKSGTGLLTINLANTYTGGTVIRQGAITHANAAATGSITTGGITLGDENSGSSSQEVTFTTGIQNLNNATAYKPVIVSASATGTATLTFNQGAAFANLSLNAGRAVTLRTTGTGSQSGMMGPISGAGSGDFNETIVFSAPAGASLTYTAGYSGTNIIPNTFSGDVRITGGGNITLQNLVYINPTFENGLIPDSSNVTINSGTTWTLGWGDETINSLYGSGTMANSSGSTNTLTLGSANGDGSFTGVMSGAGGVIKNGTGTQALVGANTYTGSNEINQGTLVLSTRATAYGNTTVADGATLATVGNGGSKWITGTLAMGSLSGATMDIRHFASSGTPCVEVTQSFSVFGTVVVKVSGLFSSGIYPLIRYPAEGIAGEGFSSLVLGALPPGVIANLVDDGAGTVSLNVTDAGEVTWTGVSSQVWDFTTANWKVGSNPALYEEGANLLFNDTVTPGRSAVVLNTTVSPAAVSFNNSLSTPYSLSGTGAITGTAGLFKKGSGKLTLTNQNTFTGDTIISGGELEIGNGLVNASLLGNIVNNSTLSFNNASAQIIANTISGTGALNKVSASTLTLTGANSYSGTTTLNQGTLQIGTGVLNGSIASGLYQLPAGTTLRVDHASLGNAGITNGGWTTRLRGAGTLRLRLAGGWPANNWGPNAPDMNVFHPEFTGTLHLEQGRTDVSPANFGGVSTVVVESGAQFLGWGGTYTQAWVLSGDGAGEAGYPGALRIAAGFVGTYAGPITLAADASMTSQDGNSIMTVSGVISGTSNLWKTSNAGLLIFSGANTFSGTMDNFGGILRLDHALALQNSTLVGSAGTVQFGSAVAGNEFTFGGLAGTRALTLANTSGVAIALRVGNNGTARTYSGILSGAGSLSKVGTGTFTLASAQSYTGNTTINAGTLLVNNASGAGTGSGTVIVNSSGVLGGTGFITGAVTVNAGGSLAPGTPIESLATGALTLAPGSTYEVEINSSGTPTADVTNVGGNVSLGGSLVLSDIATVPVALPLGIKFTIMTYAGTRTGTFAGLAEAATIAVGLNTFRIRYADGNAVTLETVVGTNSYASWVAGFGLTGNAALPNSDPDSDGIANAIEYVIGGNPATVQDQALLPTMTLVTNPGGTVPNGSYVRFRYRRTPASASLNPRVEIDTDLLAPWTNTTGASGVVQEVASGFFTSPTPADRVDVFIPRALYEVQGKLFCRLSVTVP